MADLAREEADRYFNQRTTHSSHPEDRDNTHSDSSENEQDISEPAFQSNSLHNDTDDEDISNSMSTLTTSKKTYHVPTQISYANTGPKGVIADAQSYARARQSAARKQQSTSTYKIHNPTPQQPIKEKTLTSSSDREETSSLSSLEDDDDDNELMTQWRANRLAELSSQPQTQTQKQTQPHNLPLRRVSPSRRKFGHTTLVDATGYLDAIEHSHPLTTVIVMLYDVSSQHSNEVEDELDALAEKYDSVRFVKMDHEIAEMEYVNIPALLGYRGGELFGTIGGARRKGLESELIRLGFFVD